MVEQPVATGYTVIVESIGTASPGIAKVLAEGLQLPVELVLKALYNTPSVMFSNVDEETATKAIELLQQLGLETKLQAADEEVPAQPDPVDVGIYLHDASQLPVVVGQLAAFIGCSEKDALGLLLAEPCVALGGVSMATAEALSRRLSAEVIVSDPKKELYSIVVKDGDGMQKHQLQNYFRHHKMDVDLNESLTVENLDYETTNAIWRKFQSTGLLTVINQSFQRFDLVLHAVDRDNPASKAVLTAQVGMPADYLDQILENLPVQLEGGLNRIDLANKLKAYSEAGLTCKFHAVQGGKHYLLIEEMNDLEATRKVLGQFFQEKELPTAQGAWKTPVPLGDLLIRYTTNQLEAIGCEVDYETAPES